MKWKTLLKWSTIAVFILLQAAVLFAIAREHTHMPWLLWVLAGIGVLVVVAHAKLPLHHNEHLYEDILVAIWVPVGAVLTYWGSVSLGFGPVLSASAVGLLASFIPHIQQQSTYLSQLPVAIYCGAFVGMSSDAVATSFTFVVVASILTAVFLIVSKSMFNGIGGKLGTLAFGGVALTSFLYFLWS